MQADWGIVWVVGVMALLAGALGMRELGGVGRYQIAPMSSGAVARIDTTTGEVVGCMSGPNTWPRFDCASGLR